MYKTETTVEFFKSIRDRDYSRFDELLSQNPGLGGALDPFSQLIDARAIHVAAEIGDLHIIKEILKGLAYVHYKTTGGRTALHIAVANENLEVAITLIEAGISIDGEDSGGWTSLYMAIDKMNVEIAKELLEHGANVNRYKSDNCIPYCAPTPLHLYCMTVSKFAINKDGMEKCMAMLSLFISFGAEPFHYNFHCKLEIEYLIEEKIKVILAEYMCYFIEGKEDSSERCRMINDLLRMTENDDHLNKNRQLRKRLNKFTDTRIVQPTIQSAG